MADAAKNETDPSSSSPALAVVTVSEDEHTGRAFRYLGIVAGTAAIMIGGFVFLDSRVEAKIDKHAERPHVGVATKADVDELKAEQLRQRETLAKILAAVSR